MKTALSKFWDKFLELSRAISGVMSAITLLVMVGRYISERPVIHDLQYIVALPGMRLDMDTLKQALRNPQPIIDTTVPKVPAFKMALQHIDSSQHSIDSLRWRIVALER